MPQVRLEPTTPQSQVKHSTTEFCAEPLRSLVKKRKKYRDKIVAALINGACMYNISKQQASEETLIKTTCKITLLFVFCVCLSDCLVCSLQPWSPVEKGLTSWLSCMLCFLVFVSFSHMVSWVRCGM